MQAVAVPFATRLGFCPVRTERCGLTTRAARLATFEVGHGRPVAEVAAALGCDWHTVIAISLLALVERVVLHWHASERRR